MHRANSRQLKLEEVSRTESTEKNMINLLKQFARGGAMSDEANTAMRMRKQTTDTSSLLRRGIYGVSMMILILSTPTASKAQIIAEPADDPKIDTAKFFTQMGDDPSFKSLLADKKIPLGINSTDGVKGSTIDVNNEFVERGVNSTNPIPIDIKIHTLCNSLINRSDFDKWTRWYQEDGNTQIFRLFKDECNVRNSRPDAARIESFSALKWTRGEWHEWEGTYTIVKPHGCAIFQAKNNKNDWGVMINLSDNGDITLNHRRHQEDKVIARNMTGKSFDLKVRDNGREYEVYFNGKKEGEGYYDRPEGHTCFRWGMYDKTLNHDALIFVTGAKFK